MGRQKPIIYVAGPYRGASESEVWHNIAMARNAAEAIWRAGGIALCPHLNTAFMGGIVPDKDFLDGDLQLLLKCDAVYVTVNWHESSGARAEVEFANQNSIPVLYASLDAVRGFIANWNAPVEPCLLRLRPGWDKPVYGRNLYVALFIETGQVFVSQCGNGLDILGSDRRGYVESELKKGAVRIWCADVSRNCGRADPVAVRVFMEWTGLGELQKLLECKDAGKAESISDCFGVSLRLLQRLDVYDQIVQSLLEFHRKAIVSAPCEDKAREIGQLLASENPRAILSGDAGDVAARWWLDADRGGKSKP